MCVCVMDCGGNVRARMRHDGDDDANRNYNGKRLLALVAAALCVALRKQFF